MLWLKNHLLHISFCAAIALSPFIASLHQLDLRRFRLLAVTSGSMAPTVAVGNLVGVASRLDGDYKAGEVISFSRNQEIITHRVAAVSGQGSLAVYQTKGDSNQVADQYLVKADHILGRVIINLPYLGYVPIYSRTAWGLVFLVYLPCLALIISEVRVLIGAAKSRRIQKSSLDLGVLVWVMLVYSAGFSRASFSSQVVLPMGKLRAEWSITNHVVVNEVMYYGISGNNHEWEELYNPTLSSVDISGFSLRENSGGIYSFPAGSVLAARSRVVAGKDALIFFEYNGFYPDYCFGGQGCGSHSTPLEHVSGTFGLNDPGDWVALYDAQQNLVDAVVWGNVSYQGVVTHPGVTLVDAHRLDSIERSPAGVDTDNCLLDMVVRNPGTPGW
ncbi:signal peptidase I [candidate division WWE3 bacterium CG08_land_8_20_14_0_20_43_13]|uniref:Signal peptidase I n=1 Tax=candidate division WWE3 bacterium CG08_land_8_20_14_0_20_43_13 TaxID=1975087 RepID=A0A2H0X6U4_UNCKA|nr:MAG: signal peptidase I [candidate division WWE3 bacterium CG08_land_8_20_14_0_20_43_13]